MGHVRLSQTSMMVIEPPEVSFDAAVQDKVAALGDTPSAFDAHDDVQEEWIERVRDTAEEIAESSRVFLRMQSHPLTNVTPEAGMKTRRLLEQQDIVFAANASKRLCAMIIAALRRNPAMRCIISFNNFDDLEKGYHVLTSVRTPVLGNAADETVRMMPRVLGIVRSDVARLRTALTYCMDIRNAPLLEAYAPPKLIVVEQL